MQPGRGGSPAFAGGGAMVLLSVLTRSKQRKKEETTLGRIILRRGPHDLEEPRVAKPKGNSRSRQNRQKGLHPFQGKKSYSTPWKTNRILLPAFSFEKPSAGFSLFQLPVRRSRVRAPPKKGAKVEGAVIIKKQRHLSGTSGGGEKEGSSRSTGGKGRHEDAPGERKGALREKQEEFPPLMFDSKEKRGGENLSILSEREGPVDPVQRVARGSTPTGQAHWRAAEKNAQHCPKGSRANRVMIILLSL